MTRRKPAFVCTTAGAPGTWKVRRDAKKIAVAARFRFVDPKTGKMHGGKMFHPSDDLDGRLVNILDWQSSGHNQYGSFGGDFYDVEIFYTEAPTS